VVAGAWVLAFMVLLPVTLSAAARTSLALHQGWTFRQAGRTDSHPAVVPGCVHLDLFWNGLIGDPFYRDNEKALQWIGKTGWEYALEFAVPAELARMYELLGSHLREIATLRTQALEAQQQIEAIEHETHKVSAPDEDFEKAIVGNGGTISSEEWLANLYRRAELFPALTPVQETLRPVETEANGSLPSILIADDEPDMLRFLKIRLSSHYHVLEAVDGQQAVEKACQFLPAAILLDMMMPEKDGLQACREIREHTATQGIPIILLTARADEETKMAALSAGASDFLTKPFQREELKARMDLHLKVSQAARSGTAVANRA